VCHCSHCTSHLYTYSESGDRVNSTEIHSFNERGESGPTAIETHLGWILSGPTSDMEPQDASTSVLQTHVLKIMEEPMGEVLDDIRPQLTQFWFLESIGILPDEENEVHRKFLNDIRFNGQKYCVKLPFKDQHPVIPDNYQSENSVKRLGTLIGRLQHNEDVLLKGV